MSDDASLRLSFSCDTLSFDTVFTEQGSATAQVMVYNRNKNAVVIYFADHGEEIYDWRDFAGRDESSNKSPEAIIYQNSVPMVVWCSNRYLQLHPDVNQRLEQGRIQSLMHDNVCQIIFNLAQVVTPFYHPDRDPLSDQFRPSKRLVYDHIDYDSLFCKP